MESKSRLIIIGLAGLLLVSIAFLCGAVIGRFVVSDTAEVTRIVEKKVAAEPGQELVEVEVTRLVESQVEVPVEVTRIVEQQIEVEVPVEVTRIVEVEFQPPPMPHDVFLELSGSGTLVTENYQWGACNKAVFYGEVSAAQGNFIVHLWDADCTGDSYECSEGIFNMAPYDGEVRGDSLVQIPAGNYYLEFAHTPNPPATWTLMGECQS